MRSEIAEIEAFVKKKMSSVTNPDLWIAHDFKHVDRVRNWALLLAEQEKRTELAMIEATALLYDVGLAFVSDRRYHAQIGAKVATDYLESQGIFSNSQIEQMCAAIRLHSSPASGDWLADLLRDADRMELFGAVGIMRAFSSKYFKEEYDPQNIKGKTWGQTIQHFEERFKKWRRCWPHHHRSTKFSTQPL